MATRLVLPFADVGSGIKPSDGAQLFFSDTGLPFSSDPRATFTDSGAGTPNANPVIDIGNGVFPEIYIAGSYRVVLKDKNNIQIWTADNVDESASLSQSSKSVSTIAAMKGDKSAISGQLYSVEDYAAGNNSGFLFFKVASGAAPSPDGGSQIDHDTLAVHFVQNFPTIKTTSMWGAKADSGTTNNSPIVQAAVDYVGSNGGGRIHTIAPINGGYYFLDTADVDNACVWIHYNNVTLSGDGPASLYKTTTNDHVPFHFSDEQDLTVIPSGTELFNFEMYGLAIEGTGVYENFGLAKGRGILCRNVKKVSIHSNTITDMSMIGVVVEQGDGYINVYDNQIHDCKYSAINFNGRCYQSSIDNNICSGSNAEPNTLSIQATGHCKITGNTIFGDIALPGNAGGIGWGEGNYDGVGLISGNLIKHCFFGIKAIFHGSVNITNNTLVNCIGQGGIVMSGSVSGGFTVANSNNVVTGNLILNCQPIGIDCSSEDTLISGNKVRTFVPILNPSASNEPDFIIGVTTTQGIRIRAPGCSITNNHMSGCTHGLTTTIDQVNGIIGGNTFKTNTNDYSLESATSGMFAASGHAIIERAYASPSKYREDIFRATRPTQGYFDLSSQWTRPIPAIGSPTGEIVLFAVQSTAAVGEPAGETVIELNSTSGWFASASATVCGIELDNGAWHWTTVTVVSSPNITIGTAIPGGRSVAIGANVWYNSWRALANLA